MSRKLVVTVYFVVYFSLVIVTITLCQHERQLESTRLLCWYGDMAVVPREHGWRAKLLMCLHLCDRTLIKQHVNDVDFNISVCDKSVEFLLCKYSISVCH